MKFLLSYFLKKYEYSPAAMGTGYCITLNFREHLIKCSRIFCIFQELAIAHFEAKDLYYRELLGPPNLHKFSLAKLKCYTVGQ